MLAKFYSCEILVIKQRGCLLNRTCQREDSCIIPFAILFWSSRQLFPGLQIKRIRDVRYHRRRLPVR